MANHPERLVRSTAHRNGFRPLTPTPLVWSIALLAVASACGIEEHAHELKTDINVGGKRSPPPAPPPVETGGTPSLSGGTPGTPGAGGTTGVGAGGVGGVPASSSGGFQNPAGGAGSPGAGTTSFGGAPTNPGAGGMVTQAGMPGAGGSVAMAGAPSTGGVSGVTVDINGTKLPKESVIAFIHVGHSNMAGRAMSPSSSRAYHFTEENLRAWIYRGGNWTVALEPNTAGDQESKQFNKGGPGTSLLKQALDDAPTRYFVSLGFGIASAYCSQFVPGGLYYDQLIAAPKALKGQVTFGAILIMLGITERHGTAADINGYPNCINTLVTAIRKDVGEPNLPMLINDYEMEATGSELGATSAFAQQMIPLIHKIPEVVSNSALVPTDKLPMQDDHHFNFDGQKQFTRRVLDVMKQKGWVKW